MPHASKTALPAALAALLLACAPTPDGGAARTSPLDRCDLEPVPCEEDHAVPTTNGATSALTPQPQPPVERTGGEADQRDLVPRGRGPVLRAELWRPAWADNLPRASDRAPSHEPCYEPDSRLLP